MTSTRISIARVLALDVPLTWQDAVAVAQEAAMLSEVTAAMEARPSLVTAESCFITRDGDVELPDTTDREAPEDVARLLRELLAGREAPAEVETVAFEPGAGDLSEALGALGVGQRRALIAKLATRALALDAPDAAATAPDVASPAAAPPGPAPSAPPAPMSSTASSAPIAAPFSAAVTPSPVEHVESRGPRPVLVAPRPQRPPFVATPTPTPFRAAPATAAAPVAPAPAADADARAPEVELRRLRHRSRQREHGGGLAAWLRKALPWITWRPASPDPRVLGGAIVVMAALVATVWRSDAPPAAADGVVPPRALVTSPDRVEAAPAGASAASAAGHAAAPSATPPAAVSPATSPVVSAAPPPSRGAATRNAATPAATAASVIAIGPTRADVSPATSPPAVEPAPTAPVGTAPPVETPRRAPEAAPTAPAPRSAGSRATLYSASDASVTPPVMLRQQLPSTLLEPTADVPEDWPFLEIVVDERGAVEAVRLRARSVAPGQTMYRHRMLLAAAKAWQFEPALKDGVPVRYLMRVPLEP